MSYKGTTLLPRKIASRAIYLAASFELRWSRCHGCTISLQRLLLWMRTSFCCDGWLKTEWRQSKFKVPWWLAVGWTNGSSLLHTDIIVLGCLAHLWSSYFEWILFRRMNRGIQGISVAAWIVPKLVKHPLDVLFYGISDDFSWAIIVSRIAPDNLPCSSNNREINAWTHEVDDGDILVVNSHDMPQPLLGECYLQNI